MHRYEAFFKLTRSEDLGSNTELYSLTEIRYKLPYVKELES